jgi:inner membrane protein
MDKKLLSKLASIAFLAALLTVPLMMIEKQITTRGRHQEQVKTEIAKTAAGAQTLAGPMLVVRYQIQEPAGVYQDETTGEMMTRYSSRHEARVLSLPAERLDIQGKASVESRYRGIYQARLYHLDLQLAGRFNIPADLGALQANEGKIVEARALLLLGVSDLRGLENDPEVQVNGRNLRFRASTDANLADANLDGVLPPGRLELDLGSVTPGRENSFEFAFPLKLMGTENFSIRPTAQINDVQLTSDWRHPSFQGYLPQSREIGKQGFKAEWNIVSRLSRSLKTPASQDTLGIGFIEPVNIYLQSERAIKYGVLFVVLTFAAFFLGEILRRRPMHVMQYLLVGLAQAIFFLLLIALSEHLPFLYAYLLSAAACVTLITVYLAGVLRGYRPALGFGAGFVGLYSLLYVILQAEDSALLIGSLLLFVVLSAIMLCTRNLDWYRLEAIGKDATSDAKEHRR